MRRLAAAVLTLVAWPAAAEPPNAKDGPASAELRAILDADQAARDALMRSGKPDPQAARAMMDGDRKRRQRVGALLAAGKVQTVEDFFAAALVYQHGETPEDYLTAHELAMIAGVMGRGGGLAALAEDRFLLHIGRKQRFGSQFGADADGKPLMRPVERDAPTAVTEALRADFLVPSLAERARDGAAPSEAAMKRAYARVARRTDPEALARARKRPVAAELARLAAGSDGAARVLELYRKDELFTADDLHNAALVLMRRGDTEALLLAHELAVLAAIRGKRMSGRLAGETLDRFLVSIGRPQRYGTVSGKPSGSPVPATIRAHLRLRPGRLPRARQ
jgi:hypothetical protein